MYPTELVSALPGADWLQQHRQAAAARLAELPLPTFEAEEWRYSPIADLALDRYSPATAKPADSAAGDRTVLPTALHETATAAWVSTVDGFLERCDVADGTVVVGSAGTLDSPVVLGDGADAFTAANSAFSPDPVVIRVRPGAVVDHPVVVVHDVVTPGIAAFPRLRVEVGADAEVRIVEFVRSADVDALVVPVTEIVAEGAARVRYQQIQELGRSVWQIGSLVADVGSQAHFAGALAALGAAYGRVRTDCRLVGRGASAELLAVSYGDDEQILDFRTFQEHLARDTTSDLLFKGVLDDAATSVYTGLIRVSKDAAGTNAYQTNRNIKLSDRAWAESVPNLEIENNDVRCSHASTVSPVDAEQRFYLESRGVPTRVAERLLVEGFLAEVLERTPVPEVAPHLIAAIAAKLDARAWDAAS